MAEPALRARIIVADDHDWILEEVRQLLCDDFAVVATAKDGLELLRATQTMEPDLVITDINMPHCSGIDAAGQLLKRGLCNAIIVLSMHNERSIVEGALKAGVRGYVLKQDAGDELVPAIRAVLEGKRYLPAGMAFEAATHHAAVT